MATAKKAPTKKPAKKTTTSKSVSKASSKKAETSKKVETKVTKTTTKTTTPLEQIKGLNLVSGIIYLILAVVSVVFVAPVSFKLTLDVMAIDQLATSNSAILFPANETLLDVQLRYLLAGIFVLAAIGSLLLATKLRKTYEKSINQSSSGIRWIILGITAGLTLEFVSFIAGINDIMTLKLVGGAILLTTIFGWIADKEPKVKWMAFTGAIIAGILAWFPVIGSLVGTTLYDSARFGWHVYALAGLVLLSSMLVASNQYRQMKQTNMSLKFTSREARYLRIDLVTKIAIALIVLSALAK